MNLLQQQVHLEPKTLGEVGRGELLDDALFSEELGGNWGKEY